MEDMAVEATAVADTVAEDIAINSVLKYKLLPKRIKDKWSFEDFLYYRMQEVSLREIKEFATPGQLWDFEKALNSDEKREIFNNKKLFNKYYSKYIKRGVFDFDEQDETSFEKFVKSYDRVILKPADMYAGIGIEIFDENKHSYSKLKEKGYIAEEYIKQAGEYQRIYGGSLNTIRVTTILDSKGEPDILFAVNQFGSRGSIVDNNDDTAIWAAIDVSSGEVFAADVDAKTGLVYESHPDTGEKILGFRNPCWDKVCALVLEAAVLTPECRLIGWDVAVRENYDVEIIEGNVTPELDLYQMISKRGLLTFLQEKIY